MATFAAKSGGQNFTDTWATVDSTSENSNIGGQSTYSYIASANTYVASSSFTPGAITVDGVAVWVMHTTLSQTANTYLDQGSNKFYVRLATGGTLVAGTECYMEVADMIKTQSWSASYDYRPVYYDFNFSKNVGGWYFFKFSSPVTLTAATAYTLDVKATTANTVMLGVSGGTNWYRYLRTTGTGTPSTGDRMIVCGDISPTGSSTSVTVTHDSTNSTTVFGKFEVGAFGVWSWPSTANTASYFKTSGDCRIGPKGKLSIGSSGSPIPSTSSATLDFQTTGIGWFIASRDSRVEIYGPTKTSRAYLTSNIAASATSATVTATQGSSVDPGWKNGDEIILAAASPDAAPINHWNKWDIKTLTANSSSGLLSFSANTYLHDTNSPWVANVRRNIRFVGKDASSNSLSPAFFTDDLYLRGVEFYNLDYTYIIPGEAALRAKFENCTFGKVNTNRTIITTNLHNTDFEDCVFHQLAGFLLDNSAINRINDGWVNYGEFKNCLFIAQTWQPGYAMVANTGLTNGSGHDSMKFNNCVWSSVQYTVNFYKYSSVEQTVFKDCTFDTSYFGPVISGNDRHLDYNDQRMGSGLTIIDNCTFNNGCIPQRHNLLFKNCTWNLRYANSGFLYVTGNYYLYAQYEYDRTKTSYPIVFESCTFKMDAANKTVNTPFSFLNQRVVFNEGTIYAAWGASAYAQLNQDVTFNNVSMPNHTWPATGANANSTSYDAFWRFNKFNQVDDDHRMFCRQGNIFTDSSVYDTGPRSMKVYPFNPREGLQLKTLKIPTKANTTTTLTVKVKPVGAGANYPEDLSANTAFAGFVPSLYIAKSPHLGANFSSNQEILASSDFNGSHGSYVPTDLGSNLRLWVSSKNKSDITYDSQGRVSQWNDKSGGNRHLVQSSDGKQPFYRNRGVLDEGVYFTHRKDQGLVYSGDISNGTLDKYTMAFVYRAHNPGDNLSSGAAGHLATHINSSSSKFLGLTYSGYQTVATFAYSSQTASGQSVSMPSTNGQIGVLIINHEVPPPTAWSNTTYYRSYYNGIYNSYVQVLQYNPYINDTSFVANFGTPTAFSLGCGFGSTATRTIHSADIEILEFAYINKLLSQAERDNLSLYFLNQYNVAIMRKTADCTWKTLTFTIPAPTKDCVVEAQLLFKGHSGYLNVDTMSVT